ncbi:MAG: hypothetical protein LBG87_04825 [Spirochaetaceae bacterium]|jgi:lysyl-tRNA synthetase class 2|nr:hypothetical protein [Spirochaetaceae bacterium]
MRDSRLWSEKDKNGVTRKEKLLKRQRLLEIIRHYFRKENFFEAEIPLLVSGTTPDIGIQSFTAGDKYLTASTEYHIKRMIAGGFDKVFTLTKNFRAYEADAAHNPEFTMLEWGRSQASMETIEEDLIALITAAREEFFPGKEYLLYQNAEIPVKRDRWLELTFQELFYRTYGVEIPEAYSMEELFAAARQAAPDASAFFQREPELLLSDLLDKAVKKTGFNAPVLLKKWPSYMTSSADCGADALWTVRTEAIIGGLEIADGFPFLRDYEQQQRSFRRSNARRVAAGLREVRYDEQYLAMLKNGLRPGAGMALGLDRLCMLLTDSADIREVLCFAWDEL